LLHAGFSWGPRWQSRPGRLSGMKPLRQPSPHPNAAKVALNWLLSCEGQMAYQKFGYDKDSLRIDIPKDNVPARVRRSKGVDYLVLAGPGFKNMDPINKIISEVWRKRK